MAASAVEVSSVSKFYGDAEVVKGISFQVGRGEVFGIIGPNGAGKTTTIRILLDIIKPDRGEVRVLGETLREATKNLIGYLPEERGLYRKLSVAETFSYFASLKSFDRKQAGERAARLLSRVGYSAHERKKIEELSRGMGQIVQFLVTIVHAPELVVLDEPFSGLDPVNTKLIKELILEMKAEGRTILLSTHMMNEVEELCDRILMIDRGRAVLQGRLAEIKAGYRDNAVIVEVEGEVGDVPGVVSKVGQGGQVKLLLEDEATPEEVLGQLVAQRLKVNRFEIATPSLNDIFIKVVEQGR